jgi:transposase-like protein
VHSQDLKDRAIALRLEGRSLKEISRDLHISKSTASLWLRHVAIGPEAQARLIELERRQQEAIVRHSAKKFVRRRQEAYARGLASDPSALDGLCIGLYWGEGAKASRKWSFSNSEREMVALMVGWAIRAGQSPGAFRAQIHVHPEDTITDEELRQYWSEAGIPLERIHVYRFRSPTSNRRHKGRTPYGTCQLYSVRGGAELFEYYRGQRDRLLGRSAA